MHARVVLPAVLVVAAARCSGNAPAASHDAARDVVSSVDAQTPMDTVSADDIHTPVDAIPTPDVPAALDTCRGTPEDAWTADASLCLVRFATDVPRVRGLAIAPDGDLFVIVPGSIVVLFDRDDNGESDATERATFATADGLNHGIAFSPDGRYLYASSDTTVYRWDYRVGSRTGSTPTAVITGMPGGGNHVSRTLMFDSMGRLYVTVGSHDNVDITDALNATRAMIRRFAIDTVPVAYSAGEVFASGVRNEVGLTMDSAGRIWGVENGRDDLADSRFGGDIHGDNPGERLNRFDGPGASYLGYPQCWNEGALSSGTGAGTLHADTSLPTARVRDDAFCQDATRVRPPVGTMQAHWAPLGITEYTGSVLPAAWRGDLFVTAHGSWDRDMPVGRLIARAHLDATGTTATIEPVIGQRGSTGLLQQGGWSVRPVDIRQGIDGALYFTDDQGGRVYRIGYHRP